MVVVFDAAMDAGALDKYRSWSMQNPAGYVLSVKGGSEPPKIHRATWLHIFPDPERPDYGDFTKKPKVCSTDRQEVERWASQHGHRMDKCKTCDA